jgi:hypothetical protein
LSKWLDCSFRIPTASAAALAQPVTRALAHGLGTGQIEVPGRNRSRKPVFAEGWLVFCPSNAMCSSPCLFHHATVKVSRPAEEISCGGGVADSRFFRRGPSRWLRVTLALSTVNWQLLF